MLEVLQRSGELRSLDAVVIVDADTTIDPNLLRSFDQALRRGHDWIQAYYTVANPDQSWRTRLMTYAFSLFNGVMQLGQNALGSSAGFKGNGMCFSTRGLARQAVEVVRAGGRHGIFLDAASRGREDPVPARSGGLWSDARFRGKGRGQSTAAVGVRPKRDPQEISWPAPPVAPRSAWREKTLSACELTIPSMAWLAIIYVFVAGLDVVAWFASAGSNHTRSCSGLSGWRARSCHDRRALRLRDFAVPGDAAPAANTSASVLLFPFYMGWKLLISLAGRPQTMDSNCA